MQEAADNPFSQVLLLVCYGFQWQGKRGWNAPSDPRPLSTTTTASLSEAASPFCALRGLPAEALLCAVPRPRTGRVFSHLLDFSVVAHIAGAPLVHAMIAKNKVVVKRHLHFRRHGANQDELKHQYLLMGQ